MELINVSKSGSDDFKSPFIISYVQSYRLNVTVTKTVIYFANHTLDIIDDRRDIYTL